jgi:hypothetical protein
LGVLEGSDIANRADELPSNTSDSLNETP